MVLLGAMSESPTHNSLQAFTRALERCLEQTFQEPVRLEEVDDTVSLPAVLKNGYRFSSVRIAGRQCLLMAARGQTPVPADLAVHVSLVRSSTDAVIIFAAPSLSAKGALLLIKQGVSFAVPGHVPHIPELGPDLRTYGDVPLPRATDDLSVNDEAWVYPFLPRSA